jgi:hypothetical protein
MFTLLKLLVIVVLAIAGVVVVFTVIGFLSGLLWTLVKLAVLAGVIYLAARLLLSKK